MISTERLMHMARGAKRVCVLATRPEDSNVEWARKLADADFDVIELPLLAIEALNKSELASAKAKVMKLDEYQKLIFVSQNSVNYGLIEIDNYWPQLPIGLQWLSVGKATQQSLQLGLMRHYDMAPEVLAVNGSVGNAMNSEQLLATPELQRVADNKVLIFRGKGGRPLLAEVLEQRGAMVEYCELYQRAAPPALSSKVLSIDWQKAYVLPVFSGESLENFAGALGFANKQSKVQAALQSAPKALNLVVPSERVAALAVELGFSKITVAENASESAMMSAIKTLGC